MKRTEVPIKVVPGFLSRDSKILSLGSCFAENVGNNLAADGFNISVNPAGILFNPHSIEKAIRSSLEQKIDDEHFGSYLGNCFHFDYHSRMNGPDEGAVTKNIKSASLKMRDLIVSGDTLLITFGTAWVYSLRKTGRIVANCHRVPQQEFDKVLLDLDDLKKTWQKLFSELFECNPKLKVILTVSPVRHTRKGIHENNVSKAILLLLCDYLEKNFSSVNYFPAYEIVLDELRDYSFFKDDLIHPNDEAQHVVYSRFIATYG